MHPHDGSNGARARSARIRADHDYDANRLDGMHAVGSAPGHAERVRTARARWWRAPVAAIARLAAQRARRTALEDISAAEAVDAASAGR